MTGAGQKVAVKADESCVNLGNLHSNSSTFFLKRTAGKAKYMIYLIRVILSLV